MIKRALLGGLAALSCVAAHAQNNDAAEVRKAIEATMSKSGKVDSVREAGFLGLYEIQIGDDILYTDRKASHIFVGDVLDTKSRRNLTEERKNGLVKKSIEASYDLAVKQVRGSGKRILVTFEDPNCGYCRKLAKELQGMTDVTIYTFLYPILSPDSADKSKAIWCAPDKAKAWNAWMINGAEPAPGKCDAPTDKVVALGQRLNIRGTPTIFFADGSRIPGYAPVVHIEQTLNKVGSGG